MAHQNVPACWQNLQQGASNARLMLRLYCVLPSTRQVETRALALAFHPPELLAPGLWDCATEGAASAASPPPGPAPPAADAAAALL
jgi:hypothetical protein